MREKEEERAGGDREVQGERRKEGGKEKDEVQKDK